MAGMLLVALLLLLVLLLVPPPAQAQTISTKVVGGDDVDDPLEFPYFAQLTDTSCAAVLIHDDFVISAAHCERRNHPFYKRVHFASLDINEGIQRTIQYTRSHPAYLDTLQDYDFSLLKLDRTALLDDNGNPTGVQILPINRNDNYPQPGDPLQAMGFGKTSEQSQGMNPTLQKVEINYIADDQCQDQYGPSQYFSPVMFCAGVEGGGKDTCQGDSGGPIVDIQRQVLAGIVSYGIGCAREGYAGVNARVSAVADWIDDMICTHSDYPGDNCPTASIPPALPLAVKANETGGAMTLQIQLDDYPEEFGWSLTYLGPSYNNHIVQVNRNSNDNPYFYPNNNEIYVLLPDTINEKGAELEQSFEDLPPGLYELQFGDNGSDGLCCQYGEGFLQLVNDLTGETVWEHNGEYRGYLLVRIQIDGAQGEISIVYETNVYQPSWQQFMLPNYPPDFDPEWPGPVPPEPRNSFAINFKFDAYPHETNYELLYTSPEAATMEEWQAVTELSDNEWDTVDEMDGWINGVHNGMLSNSYNEQPAGWYWLKVTDLGQDGICCSYRRGWISIMAPIITTMGTGLAWASDGEYGAGVDVYFYINDDGVVSYVFWIFDTASETERRNADNLEDPPARGKEQPQHRRQDPGQL